jgi:type I restriction enzyme, S subunit
MKENRDAVNRGHKLTAPVGWSRVRLGSLFTFGTGIPIVNYMDILRNSEIRITDLGGRVELSDKEIGRFEVQKGDVFFTRTSETVSEIGLSSVMVESPKDTVFSGFILRARPKTKSLDIYFTKYCFSTFDVRKEIIRKSTYTTRALTNGTFLSEVHLLVPPLAEQKAIAHVLGLVDKAIELNNKTIAQKELRKKWLMQNLLTGKKRLKGFTGEWKEIHIWDVAKEVSKRNRSDKQLTVLSCTKYDGLVPSLEYFGRRIFADDVSTYKIVPKGHFAYATNHIEEGSIGYQDSFEEALISPMYTVFKTDKSINDVFFFKLLKSHRLVYQYQARMEGSIDRRGGLRWDAFSIIKVQVPSLEEQTAIAKVLQTADKEIQLLKTKSERLREQKKGMMQQLLTGKKRLGI